MIDCILVKCRRITYLGNDVCFSEKTFVIFGTVSQQFYDLPSFVDLAIHGLDVLLESLLALVNIVNEVWKENRKTKIIKN
jgi:hypothetical protein